MNDNTKTLSRVALEASCLKALQATEAWDPLPLLRGIMKEVGLDPDRFTFLYTFDASSSMVRKNPEGALRAFALRPIWLASVHAVLPALAPRAQLAGRTQLADRRT